MEDEFTPLWEKFYSERFVVLGVAVIEDSLDCVEGSELVDGEFILNDSFAQFLELSFDDVDFVFFDSCFEHC